MSLNAEELSGIFVKSINPGSVADLSGRIRINDQIIEVTLTFRTARSDASPCPFSPEQVDGQSLRGFNNHQAVEVLRNTGQVVKLTLARYLRGPKFDQLQQAMAEGAGRPASPPGVAPPPAPLSPPPQLPAETQPAAFSLAPFGHRRSDSIDAVSHQPQVPVTSPAFHSARPRSN